MPDWEALQRLGSFRCPKHSLASMAAPPVVLRNYCLVTVCSFFVVFVFLSYVSCSNTGCVCCTPYRGNDTVATLRENVVAFLPHSSTVLSTVEMEIHRSKACMFCAVLLIPPPPIPLILPPPPRISPIYRICRGCSRQHPLSDLARHARA